ncbi:MAG: hypothetical protein AAFV93_03750 [Chloroflexota bacterium]
MSVTVDWMDGRYSVIHANFVDHWNWSELYSTLDACHVLMASNHNQITLILDFIGSNKVSATSALFAAKDSIVTPDAIERIVIITDDRPLRKKMVKLMGEIYTNVEEIIATKSHQEAFESVRSTMEMQAIH